jgi:hypothetical protein
MPPQKKPTLQPTSSIDIVAIALYMYAYSSRMGTFVVLIAPHTGRVKIALGT